MGKLFFSIYSFFNEKKTFGISLLAIIIFFSAWNAGKLKFSEDISKALPDNKRIERMSFILNNSALLDKLLLNISIDSNSALSENELIKISKEFSHKLEETLKPEYINGIEKLPERKDIGKLSEFISANLPLFLKYEDFDSLDTFIEKENISNSIENDYKLLIGPGGFAVRRNIINDPLHFNSLITKRLELLNPDENFVAKDGILLSKDGRNSLLMINTVSNSNTSLNKELFTKLDKLITNFESKGISIYYFGNAAISSANAERIKSDIILTVSLALIFLLLFISLFFRRFSSFVLVFIPVIFGAIVAMGVLALYYGQVSAIALGIGSVLLGISVDYAIHILSHLRENNDKKLLYRDVSTPILLSSLTTSSAFFSLLFVNSQALNHLGLFAGISVLAAALFSLLVLPHLIRNRKTTKSIKINFIDKIANIQYHKIKFLPAAVMLMSVLLWFASHSVSFDADMMKNNYMSPFLKQAEKHLNSISTSSLKSIYIVSAAGNRDEALKINEKLITQFVQLKKEGIIKSYTALNSIANNNSQSEKSIYAWNDFIDNNSDSIIRYIKEACIKNGIKASAFNTFYSKIKSEYKSGKTYLDNDLLNKISSNYFTENDSITALINVLKLEGNNKNIQSVYNAFEESNSLWIVDKRLATSELIGILKDNFNTLLGLSFLFVFIILFVAYGRLELTIITMTPVLLSWVWTVGLMGIFGISFNIFNIIILTFIFGLGIDYSIFMMRSMLQKFKYGENNLSSYRVSILLSAITTLAGIGVLIFAKHPALQSIALMSIIGILVVLFINFVIPPLIFNWMVNYKAGPRMRPVTLLDFILSILSLITFVGGALFMTLLSLLLRIFPAKADAKKLFFHYIFSKLTWFLIYMNFLSPKKIINPNAEDYSKPAVIVANHQSHIDLMLMMLLNPKVLVLTNNNNYNHPFYGLALKYADFIPSDLGFENIVEQYRPLAEKGYSLVIYPEGHRNDSGKIKRFHKGAFYVAQKLNLPILPIMIHGQNMLLKKSECFLKRGNVTTKFLRRWTIDEMEGATLKQKADNFRNYFHDEYEKLRQEFETTDFYSDYIVKNFLYKGPVLEWYTKVKLKLEDSFRVFDEIIPRKAKITDLGCGYGYLDYMLSLVSENREILAVDYDESKIKVAQNCSIRNKNVKFIAEDISAFEIPQSDVIIIKDVLHYLPQKSQLELLKKSISRLSENGLLIIRDGDSDDMKEHKNMRLTEWFSTNFGFNKTKNNLEFISGETLKKFANENNLKFEIIDTAKYTSNKIFLIRVC